MEVGSAAWLQQKFDEVLTRQAQERADKDRLAIEQQRLRILREAND